MNPDLYYTPPSDELFSELQQKAIILWSQYDALYAKGKISRIETLKNVRDNFMYMVAMFDWPNQNKLSQVLSPECRLAIAQRYQAGGASDDYNAFL